MARALIDLTGQRFGRWQVTALSRRGTRVFWLCECSCGTIRPVRSGDLRSGLSTSCSCFRAERSTRHGHQKSRVYATWAAMIQRCENPGNPGFKYYGGRGICVCERWRSFEAFLADMGEPPAGMNGKRAAYSLDRIDNDGNYKSGNCRWATSKEQVANRRTAWGGPHLACVGCGQAASLRDGSFCSSACRQREWRRRRRAQRRDLRRLQARLRPDPERRTVLFGRLPVSRLSGEESSPGGGAREGRRAGLPPHRLN